MSDLLQLTLCFGAGCALWAGIARGGLSALERWRASDALAFLLTLHVTRVAVRLAAGGSSTTSIVAAAVVSALAFAGIVALRSGLPQARALVWTAGTLGALDLVAAFADVFAGPASPVFSPAQTALSGLYMPAVVVGQLLLLRTLLRPEMPSGPQVGPWFTQDSHLMGSAFTSRSQSR